MGGVPVDRSKHSDLTDQIVDEFNKHEHFSIAITPEATRKRNPDWKKGFYFIALKANVPIVLAYIDYKEKSIGLKKTFIPTGNFEKDLIEIKQFYKNYHAKYPDLFAIE